MKKASGARYEKLQNHVFVFLSNVGFPKCFDSDTPVPSRRLKSVCYSRVLYECRRFPLTEALE
eukprot:6126470-Pyramimonas_sp.AAC.1